MKDFKNKVLVVTGGSSGLGREMAKEGARRGMKIVINGMTKENVESAVQEIKDMGAECVGQTADISEVKTIKDLFELTMDTYGQVDMLCNNAGVAVAGAIWEVPEEDVEWIIDVNLKSHLYGMKYFIPQMIKQGTEAAIVNTESTAGLMTMGSAVLYHATKHAGVAASESVYMTLKNRGLGRIMVHALVPAFIKTTIHESDSRRPQRYAMGDNSYYQSQEYKGGLFRSTRGVLGGIEKDYVGKCVFTAVEEKRFYIFTNPESQMVAAQRVQNMVNGLNPQ